MRGERLNPTGINWPNFMVAAMGGRIVGAAQIRKHSDGSRELGSLVVAKDERGHGIASRMIDTLLAEEREPVWMITSEPYAKAYARWGFERIEPGAAPVKVRLQLSDRPPGAHRLILQAAADEAACHPGTPSGR